jgi:hypothetical protein
VGKIRFKFHVQNAEPAEIVRFKHAAQFLEHAAATKDNTENLELEEKGP